MPPTVLVIAGNDPSGGAGMAADIQAIRKRSSAMSFFSIQRRIFFSRLSAKSLPEM